MSRMPERHAPGEPVPRAMNFDFQREGDPIPRWWMGGSPFFTHLTNGLNLLFPPGERFFIRSVKRYLPQIEDEALRQRVRAFFQQEAYHGREHERFNEILEAQGFVLDPFLARFNKLAFEWLEERFSPELRLSTTVALEHFTASLGERALSEPFLEEFAHPAMAELLRWHAAEEIEHKSVAFDVLQAVAPSYGLRVRGLMMASASLLVFWAMAVATLMAQEPKEVRRRALRDMFRSPGRLPTRTLLGAIAAYLRPDFHPDQQPNDHLAREVLGPAA